MGKRLQRYNPKVDRRPDGLWELLEDFTYESQRFGKISIPKGYIYDKASIHRILWSFIDPDDLGEAGPLLHDWLYGHCGKLPERLYTREEVDILFYSVMKEDNVLWIRRAVAYDAVRLCGWVPWGKHCRKRHITSNTL